MNSNKFKRIMYIVAGTVFVGLGSIGIFLPILPTTPFLIVAAACYYKGSPRLHQWMIHNKWFGVYLKNYLEGKGIPLKTKVFTIVLLWTSIGVTALFLIRNLVLQILLFIIAIAVSTHLLTLPTKSARS